jgi:hypothetical protein
MAYAAKHQLDETGARYESAPIDYEGENIMLAIEIAESMTFKGQAGFVQRTDGAVLAPDGLWVVAD